MPHGPVRMPAVAGSWYPATPQVLEREVDAYCAAATPPLGGALHALVAPHAGLMYSGPVAAYAYRQLEGREYELVVLVGPSHYVGFAGVSVFPSGQFQTPLGVLPIAEREAEALMAATDVVIVEPAAHSREHSLEMQLPFLARFLPGVPILPLVMGYQARETVNALASALACVLGGRRVLFVASSDLSHYHDAATAARLDRVVLDAVEHFSPDALQTTLDRKPDHACGGGPIVAVMRAARSLGAVEGRVLRYADSGDVSGDKAAVVGYMAAAFGIFDSPIGRSLEQ